MSEDVISLGFFSHIWLQTQEWLTAKESALLTAVDAREALHPAVLLAANAVLRPANTPVAVVRRYLMY